MKLSYGQIYITLQCGPTSQRSQLNVISFKVSSHCAFASRALILCVLELAKGNDVIAESVLRSLEFRQITRRHKSEPSRRARCMKLLSAPFVVLQPAVSFQGPDKVPTEFKVDYFHANVSKTLKYFVKRRVRSNSVTQISTGSISANFLLR